MTYAEQAATAHDPEFSGRVIACGVEQSLIFIDDSRPEFYLLAEQIIAGSGAAGALVPLVAGKAGITSESEDPDLLAAVQAVWPVYGATLVSDA